MLIHPSVFNAIAENAGLRTASEVKRFLEGRRPEVEDMPDGSKYYEFEHNSPEYEFWKRGFLDGMLIFLKIMGCSDAAETICYLSDNWEQLETGI